ncbi:MAG: hypothetical protein KUG79_12425 [Pseudomonadales bacterium]|nr:hypothetical protein [Pseudomonadales bacterium]
MFYKSRSGLFYKSRSGLFVRVNLPSFSVRL